VRFSAAVHTGPGAHPVSYTTGTNSLLGVKWPGRGIDHPSLLAAEVKGRIKFNLNHPFHWGLMACSRENFVVSFISITD
jgi:hypothetical protein